MASGVTMHHTCLLAVLPHRQSAITYSERPAGYLAPRVVTGCDCVRCRHEREAVHRQDMHGEHVLWSAAERDVVAV